MVPSLTVVQGDPWIQDECRDGTDREPIRRKAGSVSKSGRPEYIELRLAVLKGGKPEGSACSRSRT